MGCFYTRRNAEWLDTALSKVTYCYYKLVTKVTNVLSYLWYTTAVSQLAFRA